MAHLTPYKGFFLAVATSFVGTLVRFLNDKEVEEMTRFKKWSYFITGLFVGYLVYALCRALGRPTWIGFACAFAGVSSGWIIKLIIKDLPTFMPDVLMKFIYKKFGVEADEKKQKDELREP